jgi:hypothetical protein
MIGPAARRRVGVRRSPIHGRGLFALRGLDAGRHLIEYRGQIITWRAALLRHASTGADGYPYFFDRGDGTVIDGAVGGNGARYLNHSCEPNCEAVNPHGHIHIYTSCPIRAGSELLLDYQLRVDQSELHNRLDYPCSCTAATCRDSMLTHD